MLNQWGGPSAHHNDTPGTSRSIRAQIVIGGQIGCSPYTIVSAYCEPNGIVRIAGSPGMRAGNTASIPAMKQSSNATPTNRTALGGRAADSIVNLHSMPLTFLSITLIYPGMQMAHPERAIYSFGRVSHSTMQVGAVREPPTIRGNPCSTGGS